jgi:hypothetical protein
MKQLTKNCSRNKIEIADAILKYNKSNGSVVSGLVVRRNKEYTLFTKGVYPDGTSLEVQNNIPTNATNITENTTIKDIVDMTIDGKFGNGDKRKENWCAMLQKFVNARY